MHRKLTDTIKIVKIADPKIIKELEKNARKIIKLLHRGIHFTPTQPDVTRIEKSC